MRNVMENLDAALQNPLDETARSNLMWDSTMALNGMIQAGKEEDWMAHKIEHALSAFYDIPHGAGLAICHLPYLSYICHQAPEKFARYAVRVMGCDPKGKTNEELAEEGIGKTREYFKRIGAPVTLSQVGIPAGDIDKIVEKILLIPSSYTALERKDLKEILNSCI